MKTAHKVVVLALVAGMGVSMILPPIIRAAAPAGGAGATKAPTDRSAVDIANELDKAGDEIKDIMPNLMQIGDADFRKESGAKVVPALKKIIGLFDELEKVSKSPSQKEEAATNKVLFLAFASAFGDADSIKALNDAGAGKGDDAVRAKAFSFVGRWLAASKDDKAQTKVLEEITPLAKENEKNSDVASALNFMATVGAANNDMTKKTIDVIRDNIKVQGVDSMLASLDASQAQLALIGKPLAIEGRTSTDGKFNVSAYKGKVVMIDFWATWCGPCIGELPNVKAAYKKYHDQGFEIVGMSCDDNDAELNAFIKKEGMTWVQMREKTQTPDTDRWHPLAKKYGVDGIPQMFLIDKNGVLRYVDAREDLEKKIAILIAEKAKDEAGK